MVKTHAAVDCDALLQSFLEMVRLDSPSGQEGPVREYLVARLNALGVSSTVDAAGNIIAWVPACGTETALTLAVTAHMDVVPPCIGVLPLISGEAEDRLVQASGETVLGADDKAGLATILEALAVALKNDLPRPNLLFLLTVEEELMLNGAKKMDPAVYADADFVIALDHTGKQGTLVYEAPTYISFQMTVHGKSVHAGIMPEKGINAIKLLAQALERLEFGRLDENTTCNVGFIEGGKATNVVPDRAVARGELRGHDDARLQQQLTHMASTLMSVVDSVDGARAEFEHAICFKHYRHETGHPHLQRIAHAAEDLGLPVQWIRTNGGSDVNIFAENGLPGTVLSAGYMEPHSLNERVFLKDMVTCTRFLLAIWERFAKP